MKKILAEIQSGEFAQNWIEENNAGQPALRAFRQRTPNLPTETVGRHVRRTLPIIDEQE